MAEADDNATQRNQQSGDTVTAASSMHESLAASICAHGTPLYGEIVSFLYREAELLDDCQFSSWLALFTEDTHYVMPVRTTQFRATGDGFHDVAFFDENFVSLRTRVKRLETNFAWAETPPSRTRHFISNVLVEPANKKDEFAVRSNFMVTRTRSDQGYQLFTGQRQDILRRVEDSTFKIADRRILIDQTTLSGSNLSVFF
jgi:3-phenylpropionate/cinnamic acid dioxygenase small subunit